MPLNTLKKYVLCLNLLLTACLAGCTTLTIPQHTQRAIEIHRLQTLDKWKLSGAIAVQSPKTSESASLTWQQQEQNYQLHFFGLLGMGSTYLTGTSQSVSLTTAQGQRLTAKTPEELLAQLGWQLPVSNLIYWIRGLPNPKLPAQKFYTDNGLLLKLQQQDWQVDYLNYQTVQGLSLPSKIKLSSPILQAKIVVYHWELLE